MGDIQKQTGMSWIEVQFLAKAVETLRDCRTTLMYTYVFAYYLAKNSEVSPRSSRLRLRHCPPPHTHTHTPPALAYTPPTHIPQTLAHKLTAPYDSGC